MHERFCCAWSSLSDVLGVTDPRLNHASTQAIWMQQHPDVSFGAQVDQTPAALAATTSQNFVEWREDDGEVAYCSKL